MHNAKPITTGSANQRSITPSIRLWIDVTFRGLEDSYMYPGYSFLKTLEPSPAIIFIEDI